MIVKCADCGKDLGERPPYDDHSMAKGLCVICRRTAEFEMKLKCRRTAEFEMKLKNSAGRYNGVRDTKGQLIEFCDHQENILWQKARSGWYETPF